DSAIVEETNGGEMNRGFLTAIAPILFVAVMVYPAAGQGRGGRGTPAVVPQSAQAAATNDLDGYWVRIVTEDWRWLMAVPAKGNADSIPISAAGRAILDAWDPAKDEAEGNQCKGYGAGAISRIPTRAHVTWQ